MNHRRDRGGSPKPVTQRTAMRPNDRKYTETHEWVKSEGDTMLIGITDFAVASLSNGNEGDLVYCDLPESGRILEAGQTFGEIESVKAVADLNSPVAGEVLDINPAIEDHLEGRRGALGRIGGGGGGELEEHVDAVLGLDRDEVEIELGVDLHGE